MVLTDSRSVIGAVKDQVSISPVGGTESNAAFETGECLIQELRISGCTATAAIVGNGVGTTRIKNVVVSGCLSGFHNTTDNVFMEVFDSEFSGVGTSDGRAAFIVSGDTSIDIYQGYVTSVQYFVRCSSGSPTAGVTVRNTYVGSAYVLDAVTANYDVQCKNCGFNDFTQMLTGNTGGAFAFNGVNQDGDLVTIGVPILNSTHTNAGSVFHYPNLLVLNNSSVIARVHSKPSSDTASGSAVHQYVVGPSGAFDGSAKFWESRVDHNRDSLQIMRKTGSVVNQRLYEFTPSGLAFQNGVASASVILRFQQETIPTLFLEVPSMAGSRRLVLDNNTFVGASAALVPAGPGVPTLFLRSDGQWAGPLSQGPFASISSCVFTGMGAVSQNHGQTQAAFNTIPSSVFQILSIGGPVLINFAGTVGCTGPLAGATKDNRSEFRVTVGSSASIAYGLGLQASASWQGLAMIHSTSLSTGVFTGSIQWRRAGGNAGNMIGEAVIAITSHRSN